MIFKDIRRYVLNTISKYVGVGYLDFVREIVKLKPIGMFWYAFSIPHLIF